MEILYLLNFAIALAILIFPAINFFIYHKDKKVRRIIEYISIVGLLYLILSALFLLWGLGVLAYDKNDFLIVYSIVIFIESIVLFKLLYSFTRKRSLFYLLVFYLASLISIFIFSFEIPSLVLLFSFLMLLIIFINFIPVFSSCSEVCYLGVFYALASLIFQALLFFGVGRDSVFVLASNIVFLIFTLFLITKAKEHPPEAREASLRRREPYVFIFLKYFVFIIVLSNFILMGTVGLHEAGHIIVSKFYDCGYRRVIYAESSAYTEVLCSELSGNSLVILGAVFLPLLVAFLLFFIGGKFMKEISFLIGGFDFIISYKDFTDLGFSENVAVAGVALGMVFLIIGVVSLAKSRTED
jgi:hypothetical protein